MSEKESMACTWAENEDGYYDTECDNTFILTEGTPDQNNMRFCTYCGRPLVERGYAQEEQRE
jgi:hypothetical protein